MEVPRPSGCRAPKPEEFVDNGMCIQVVGRKSLKLGDIRIFRLIGRGVPSHGGKAGLFLQFDPWAGS